MIIPGATHAELVGAAASFRYRPARLAADAVAGELSCQLVGDGTPDAPVAVLDVSETGLGVAPPAGWFPPHGTRVELTLLHRGTQLWTGAATVVYQVVGPPARLGLRFAGQVLSVERIRVRENLASGALAEALGVFDQVRAQLPDAWRAQVADAAQLLRGARDALADYERAAAATDVPVAEEETLVFAAVWDRWGPVFCRALSDLHALSATLTPDVQALARRYAEAQIYPLVAGCPMHRRAHDKPRGYAGDYQMMRLYFTERHQGSTLFDRFMHYVSQRYSLGYTVVAREAVMREAAGRAITSAHAAGRPARLVSLACGPALELQRLLGDLDPASLPAGATIELILIDQDDEALAYCHQALARIAAARGLPVELHALHFSVRQLLKPRDEAERAVVTGVLQQVDLIYSAGLVDYLPRPVAAGLVSTLYGLLSPGGRLLVGNLKVAPDTSWMMDYVLAWHLEYRVEADMEAMAVGLRPAPTSCAVTHDRTGLCMFLDLHKA